MADTIVAPQVNYFTSSSSSSSYDHDHLSCLCPGPESEFEANITLQTLHDWQHDWLDTSILEEVLTTQPHILYCRVAPRLYEKSYNLSLSDGLLSDLKSIIQSNL